MAIHQVIPLTASPTRPGTADFQAILNWPFADQPFYIGQVKRLLQNDIPQRVLFGSGMFWVYRDPDGNVVGFGTLDVCKDCGSFTNGDPHCYIPVLAVHPDREKCGHGRSIVQHLVAESALLVKYFPNLSKNVYLDVYKANPAVSVYLKCGFEILNPDSPILDPQENNEPYFIMAKNVAIAT